MRLLLHGKYKIESTRYSFHMLLQEQSPSSFLIFEGHFGSKIICCQLYICTCMKVCLITDLPLE